MHINKGASMTAATKINCRTECSTREAGPERTTAFVSLVENTCTSNPTCPHARNVSFFKTCLLITVSKATCLLICRYVHAQIHVYRLSHLPHVRCPSLVRLPQLNTNFSPKVYHLRSYLLSDFFINYLAHKFRRCHFTIWKYLIKIL